MAVSRDLDAETRRSPAHRRHLRTAITMLVLATFVAFAGWYAWNTITNPRSADVADATVAPTCIPAVPTDAPAPADIRVNVYNATTRNGLASSAARALPLGKTVAGTAEVRAGADNEAAAAVVVAQVSGAFFVVDDRTDGTVDLVVGEAFKKLAPARATPAPAPSGGPPAC
jgi:LytR cell envelope-related transcriptional attenuator